MFDFSSEFNKVRSTDASDMLGGVSQMNKAREQRMAGTALANYAKVKQAEVMADKGIYAAPQMQQQRSPGFGETLFGGLASGLTGGINNVIGEMAWNNERYGSPSLTPFRGPLPSTTTDWAPPPPLPPIGP